MTNSPHTLAQLTAALPHFLRAYGHTLPEHTRAGRICIMMGDYSVRAIPYREIGDGPMLRALGMQTPDDFMAMIRDIHSQHKYPVLLLGSDGVHIRPVWSPELPSPNLATDRNT